MCPHGENELGKKCVPMKKTKPRRRCGPRVKMGPWIVPCGGNGVRKKMGLGRM
jgi:hypothetical protein